MPYKDALSKMAHHLCKRMFFKKAIIFLLVKVQSVGFYKSAFKKSSKKCQQVFDSSKSPNQNTWQNLKQRKVFHRLWVMLGIKPEKHLAI